MKATRASDTDSQPLGEILLAQGLITRAELDAALSYRENKGLKIGQALVALHLASPSEVSSALRSQGRFHCVDLDPCMVDGDVAASLGAEASRRLQAIAIHRIGDVVTVAMEDPLDTFAIEAIEASVRAPIFAVLADPKAIHRALDAIFPLDPAPTALEIGVVFESAAPEVDALDRCLDIGKAGDLGDRTKKLVDAALADARSKGASEVVLEPAADGFEIRYAIDGEIRSRARCERDLGVAVASYLRANATGDLERGAFLDFAAVGGRRPRATIACFAQGEIVRIALPDDGVRFARLEKLGLTSRDRHALEALFEHGTGLVAVTSPPAGGRTTTLDACARAIVACARRTLLHGLDPASVAGAFALDDALGAPGAADAVRASGAQAVIADDADRTGLAPFALDLAREGRLVVASVAAAGPVAALDRLARACGADEIERSLACLVTQRLARRLCTSCRRETRPPPSLVARFSRRGDEGPYWVGAGCDACQGRGVRGRVALFEVAFGSRALAGVRGTAEVVALSPAALSLAIAGEVSLEELARTAA